MNPSYLLKLNPNFYPAELQNRKEDSTEADSPLFHPRCQDGKTVKNYGLVAHAWEPSTNTEDWFLLELDNDVKAVINSLDEFVQAAIETPTEDFECRFFVFQYYNESPASNPDAYDILLSTVGTPVCWDWDGNWDAEPPLRGVSQRWTFH